MGYPTKIFFVGQWFSWDLEYTQLAMSQNPGTLDILGISG